MPLEQERDGVIVYRDITIRLRHGAEVVRAKIGNGISLNGEDQYMTLGDHGNSCFGNLEMCTNGMTLAFYLQLERMIESGYIVSAGPYSIYTKDGRVHFKYVTFCFMSTGSVQARRYVILINSNFWRQP